MNHRRQPAPAPLRGRMYKPDGARSKQRRILALKTGIAGMEHYVKEEAEQAVLDSLTPGTELLLFREPHNRHDEWAISVHLTEESKLGFITRFKNETIARLMDAGKKFVAVVDEPEPESKDKADRSERTARAPTENMALPLSIYLVEEL